jgi:hypothetical protein
MTAKLIGAAVATVVALALMGIGLALRPAPRLHTPAEKAASVLARTLTKNARDSADTPRIGWVVTKATSAQYMMVVDVEAERLSEARGIAIQIVEPVRSHGYDEILIYVRQPGSREAAVRRIQWTPRGGYVESTFSDR